MAPRTAPYGTWRSPISAALVAAAGNRWFEIQVDGTDVYWAEDGASDDGRVPVFKRTRTTQEESVLPPGFSARSRVHEYGGGNFTVYDGMVFFVNEGDQRVYRVEPGQEAVCLTPDVGETRFADLAVDASRRRLLCVGEDHSLTPPRNSVVAVHMDSAKTPETLVEGRDFYAAPRASPDGSQICWLEWDHPNMPWDGTHLWIGDFDELGGRIVNHRTVAGGTTESVLQPQWAPDGALYFVSDRTGWWNIVKLAGAQARLVTSVDMEFARPPWVFHISNYAFLSADQIVAAASSEGQWRLYLIDTSNHVMREIPTEFTDLGHVVKAWDGRIVCDAASPTSERALVTVDPSTGHVEALSRQLPGERLSSAAISIPTAVAFPTGDNNTEGYGFLYRPHNPEYAGPADDRPPLIVRAHGGPTSAFTPILDYATQYWTSRGFAVLDVNYGGSSGYGRAYRERLNGRWGELDSADCRAAARFLSEQGLVDGNRLLISGDSAGGLTVLSCLARGDVFHGGASYFGVADLEAFARDTHKFESRYCERLVGRYPASRNRYIERSPANFVTASSSPVMMFQGAKDAVVPLAQAEAIIAALQKHNVPCVCLVFEEEYHGFRIAANRERCLEAEHSFYAQVLGIPYTGDGAAVEINSTERLAKIAQTTKE